MMRKVFKNQGFLKGIALIELLISMAVSVIPVSLVGVLLVSGQYNWRQTYEAANNLVEIRSESAATIFGRIGRKSDRNNCELYAGSTVLTGDSGKEMELLVGDVVEFRYWEKAVSRRGQSSSEVNRYARFYLEDGELKVDYGPYPHRNSRKVSRTVVVAESVDSVQFGRMKVNNVEQGSVSMELKLELTPEDDEKDEKVVKAVTLLRN